MIDWSPGSQLKVQSNRINGVPDEIFIRNIFNQIGISIPI